MLCKFSKDVTDMDSCLAKICVLRAVAGSCIYIWKMGTSLIISDSLAAILNYSLPFFPSPPGLNFRDGGNIFQIIILQPRNSGY